MTSHLYWSDTHFFHTNIIQYCQRPFADVHEMGVALFHALWNAELTGSHIFHLGDFALNAKFVLQHFGKLQFPERHTLISGNHERTNSRLPEMVGAYSAFFGRIVGTEKTWQQNTLRVEDFLNDQPVTLLLSHLPQQDLQGADFNLYGHVHNSYVLEPARLPQEYPWLVGSSRHFNVCAEVIGYRPRSFAELVGLRNQGHALL